MSREVLGQGDDELLDAPTRAIPLRSLRPAADITTDGTRPLGAVAATDQRSRTRRTSQLATLVAAALAAGAAAGWSGTGTQARTSHPVDVAVWAAVSTIDDAGARGAMSARIRVVNDGRERVTITARIPATGAPRWSRAALTAVLDPPALTVPGGARADLAAVLQVDCSSPLVLDLDPMIATRPDGTARPIPVQGAASELMRICAARAAVLRLHRADQDGGRLRVGLTVPGGRSLRVVAVTAGGLELSGRPFPAQVDGQVRSIWLDPPTSCPQAWQALGVPRVLTVIAEDPYDQGSGSSQARITLLVGDALAGWLMDGGCPADA